MQEVKHLKDTLVPATRTSANAALLVVCVTVLLVASAYPCTQHWHHPSPLLLRLALILSTTPVPSDGCPCRQPTLATSRVLAFVLLVVHACLYVAIVRSASGAHTYTVVEHLVTVEHSTRDTPKLLKGVIHPFNLKLKPYQVRLLSC